MSKGAVLVAEHLKRSFSGSRALAGLSLEVRVGEIYGLIGPDGAGKTTALRIMAGVMAPDAGSVRVAGRDPLSAASDVRRSIGYMPQQYSLYGDLTVDENLHFFSRMSCLSRAIFGERRERLLAITRLAPFTRRRADALSGGMYKKLALACALLPRPEILILDEPTNGVDPVSRRDLWSLFAELVRDDMAILVSTAYMDEAARCQRVGLIHEGRLLLEDAPHGLLAAFPHPAFSVVDGDQPAAERIAEGHDAVLACSFAGRARRIVVRSDSVPSVMSALAHVGARLEPAELDVEDVFLASTVLARREAAVAVLRAEVA